jgi:hypothetical protein
LVVLCPLALLAGALSVPQAAQAQACELEPQAACFGLESVEATLSAPAGSAHPATRAGAHPDLTLTFEVKTDPESDPNPVGLKDSWAATRNIRFELPPGFVGDPNVLGPPQQCTAAELSRGIAAECPNGSQVGVSKIFAHDLNSAFTEPVYMMQPPGGDVVARLGTVAGTFPTFIDFKVRSESDYGIVAEIVDATAEGRLIRVETRTWGIPAHESHDTERCTPGEVFVEGCIVSEPRPPGSLPLPFLSNPTRCNAPLSLSASVASWPFPDVFDTKSVAFPPIKDCEKLPFGPDLSIAPTNRRAGAPTGLDVTLRVPRPEGFDVLEPSQTRDVKVLLPAGVAINPGAADGLDTCSESEVKFGERVAARCPDAAKVASVELDVPALPRRMKGAFYLREPEPGNLFRVWVVADDLGAHVKLPGELEVDEQSGQITSVLLDLPQFPLREAKLFFPGGSRAPLVNPPACGTHATEWEFVPWSGTPPAKGASPMTIDEGCEGLGGFSPQLSAGTTNLSAGKYSPFLFTLTRADGEQNPERIDITLPQGLAAKLAGVPRCEGAAAASGNCPPASQIGIIRAASGYGVAPLWVPQPGKDPTAFYLGGPYKGAPFSAIAVVPAQAGPFDLGEIVVRSAIEIDPRTAQASVKSDPIPQIIEGIPIPARTIHVLLDRPNFALNPTGCKEKEIVATVTSSEGATASPSARFQAVDCASLRFKPKLSFRLFGATHRGTHPKLRAVLRTRPGDANIAKAVVALPSSEFLDQGHIKTVCTRVQFAAEQCPLGSIYGQARAISPLLDKPLVGPVYLRSSNNPLPDLVVALKGEVEVDLVGRIDSVRGGIRTTFAAAPDAPVSKFVLTMQGGRKGLLINSRNLCKAPGFADVDLDAQNGKSAEQRPPLKSSCGKTKRAR